MKDLKDYLPGNTYTSGQWVHISIPLSTVGFANFAGNGSVVIQSNGSSAVVLYIDNMEMVGSFGESSAGNPHAVTDIAGVLHDYDANGNLLTTSAGQTNAWTYRNELAQSIQDGITVQYGYDHDGQRVVKDNGSLATIYPSSLLEVKGATTTKYIYAGDALVATIENDTPAPKRYYVHVDHLNSSNVLTDETGYIQQLLTVYPFGDSRVDEEYGNTQVAKQFTGHERDEETTMSYMGARYQSGEQGRFISQDPANLEAPQQFLYDPQQLNTYSYTRNNPLKYIDPDGEKIELVAKPVVGVGNHLFYRVTPDNPDGVSVSGVPAGTTEFTLGAYNPDGNPFNNRLQKAIGCAECSGVSTDFGAEGRQSITLNAPNGMSDTDFINSLGSAYNSTEDGQNYYLRGPGSDGYSNSNNFVYDIGSQVGVGDQVSSFNPRGITPGNNRSLAAPNQPSRYRQTLSSIRSTLGSIKSALSKKNESED